jgi:NUMOD4 motif/HNH endonuclease
MTIADSEMWRPVPGFGGYEASDHGQIRSVDRKVGDRSLKGTVLKTRPSNAGYLLVNLTDDQGHRQTRTVHTLVMRAFVGPCPAGMETRHLDDDPLNNRWAPTTPPGNLVYGTKEHQEDDKYRNGRPRRPRYEPRPCIVCGAPVDRGGRRCHGCVVKLGEQAAALLRSGVTLEEANDQLGYGNGVYLHTLAVKYGGWGTLPPPQPSPDVTTSGGRGDRRRVTVRDIFRAITRR